MAYEERECRKNNIIIIIIIIIIITARAKRKTKLECESGFKQEKDAYGLQRRWITHAR